MGMKRVLVHIDRLVLKGFGQQDRHAIALGLQEELGRVFGDRDCVQHLSTVGDTARLPVGAVHVGHGSVPQRIGVTVAREIHKAIKK
jgi:hypothetical protein